MKVKNLLLAGLAAFAMASCSNEEIIDNGNQGNQGEKTSQMQFGIEFPQNTATRAGETTEVGTTPEYDFSRIAVVIFANGNKSVLIFKKADFTTVTAPAGSNNKLFLKNSISVEAGASELYAFVNPTDALMGSLNSAADTDALLTLTESAGYGNLDVLKENNKIAKDEGFLMSNAGGEAVLKTFITEKTQDVTIQVDRVAAKMEEKSPTTAFDVTGEQSKPSSDATLKITLGQYTFTNLATTTSVLYNENYTTAGYFQKVGDFGKTKWTDFSSKNITGVTDGIGDITYIMENIGGNAIPTRIMYEASASWNDQPAKTFYILADGKVYLSFDELQANVNISDLTENSDVVEFAAKGIKKYVDGKCYYSVDIKTNGTDSKIVRNNVYKLKVSSIAKLGTTTPTPDPTPTSINLTVDIKAWTVNTQENIELK